MIVRRLVVEFWGDRERVYTEHPLSLLIGVSMVIGSDHLCLCM